MHCRFFPCSYFLSIYTFFLLNSISLLLVDMGWVFGSLEVGLSIRYDMMIWNGYVACRIVI